MALLVSAVALGVLFALLRYREYAFSRLAALPIKHPWLALLAILLQIPLLRSDSRILADLQLERCLFVVSWILLVLFVWFNRNLLSILVLGIGLVLNLTVIITNQGLMPITPETLVTLNPGTALTDWQPGEHYAYSKNVILTRENTQLWQLSDILVMPYRLPKRYAFSMGDLLIAIGIVVLLTWLPSPMPGSNRKNSTRNPVNFIGGK